MILERSIISNDQMIIKLVEAFINQYDRKLANHSKNSEGEFSSNLANKKFLPFTALVFKVFDSFSIKDHLVSLNSYVFYIIN